MSAFLAEVLSSAESFEIDTINAKIPDLSAQVATCRSEILTYLENVYVKFLERPKQNKVLGTKAKDLEEEIEDLVGKMRQVNLRQASKSLEAKLEELDEMSVCCSLVGKLVHVHESLIEIKRLQDRGEYSRCLRAILEVESSACDLEVERVQAFEELELGVANEKMRLQDALSRHFKENVIFGRLDAGSRLEIKNESDKMEEVVSALFEGYHETSVYVLGCVTRFLWDHVFVPIVDYKCLVDVTSENDFAIMQLTIVEQTSKCSYKEVFAQLKTVVEFLMANFNLRVNEESTTLSLIGQDLRDNLSELVIKHCLEDTIPTTNEGVQQYKSVIEATEGLETVLKLSQIFSVDTTPLLEYANNVDVLFINKKCLNYVTAAKELMKKDLHDMVEVESNQDFPHCSVSRSVIDLIALIESILTQATTSSEEAAGRLFCTVTNICHTYLTFVPEQHKKLLQTIPQQVALFYNNCMYLSHNLNHWNKYLQQLPSILNLESSSFNDQGKTIQETASDLFNSFVDSQIKQIQEIMKDCGLNKPTLEALDTSTEKCIRQCLRQQELLKTVWHKVLPYERYNRTLGVILNTLCTIIIGYVVKFEDISSDAAEQLVELLKMVQTRGPKLFTDAKEVSLFVPEWCKLNEVVFVLNSDLMGIGDRWADGKGPLQLQFRAEELKQLVRALFQNTEKRGALLAKIYD